MDARWWGLDWRALAGRDRFAPETGDAVGKVSVRASRPLARAKTSSTWQRSHAETPPERDDGRKRTRKMRGWFRRWRKTAARWRRATSLAA
jgi:hypothetical protein